MFLVLVIKEIAQNLTIDQFTNFHALQPLRQSSFDHLIQLGIAEIIGHKVPSGKRNAVQKVSFAEVKALGPATHLTKQFIRIPPKFATRFSALVSGRPSQKDRYIAYFGLSSAQGRCRFISMEMRPITLQSWSFRRTRPQFESKKS